MIDPNNCRRLKNEILLFKPILDGQMVSHIADALPDKDLQMKVSLAGLWLAYQQDKPKTRLIWGTPAAERALSIVISLASQLDLRFVEQEILRETTLLRFREWENHQN